MPPPTSSYQYGSTWGFGDVFFVDVLNEDSRDGFNDVDLYAELYVNFSLGKIFSHGICPACAEQLYPGISTNPEDDRG